MPYNEKANLISYLPPYYAENEEANRLMSAENPEIDDLWDALRVVKDNQFILTADDRRIRLWEKLLRLKPDYATQSLDYRKNVVIMRLSARLPLVYRWLVTYTADIVELDKFSVSLSHNQYSIKINFIELPEFETEYYSQMRRLLPANLELYFTHTRRMEANKIYTATPLIRDTARIRIPPKLPGEMRAGKTVLHVGAALIRDYQKAIIPTRRLDTNYVISGTAGYIGTTLLRDTARIRIPTAPLREMA